MQPAGMEDPVVAFEQQSIDLLDWLPILIKGSSGIGDEMQ